MWKQERAVFCRELDQEKNLIIRVHYLELNFMELRLIIVMIHQLLLTL